MKKDAVKIPRCAECKIEKKICSQEDGNGPAYCPTIDLSDVIKTSLSEYDVSAIKKFALNATIQEGECYVNKGKDNPHVRYGIKPRIQETIEFAREPPRLQGGASKRKF